MADRGRDLKVSILSDADRFDAEQPARQLDQLADAATDAGRQLTDLDRTADRTGAAADRLGSDATGAAQDVDKLGDQAQQTARRVDASFDKIAAASKRGAADVDQASDRGKRALEDMGEEGQGTAREMAASFDGTADGIKDAMQEAATNVLAVLGPLGAAVGVAGGVAIGWLRGQAEQLKEEVGGIVTALIDAGDQGRQALVTDRLAELAESGEILELADQARRAKLPVSEFLRAMAGDPDALARTREAIDATREASDREAQARRDAGTVTRESARAYVDLGTGLAIAQDSLDATAEKYGLAADAAAAYTQALPPGREAQEAFNESVSDYTDVSATYADLLTAKEAKERETAQATAAATKDQSDSWEDYARDVKVSVSDYLAELRRQVTAQEDWAANLEALAERGVTEGVLAELARMGPEGAPLVADLVDATDAELAEMVRLYERKGAAATDRLAAALEAGRTQVTGVARRIWRDAQDTLDSPLTIPTAVAPPAAFMLSAARQAIQSGLGTVRVPVMLQNVPQSVWAKPRYAG